MGKYLLALILFILGLADFGGFYLGYYITDKIDINSSIETLRDEIKDTVIDQMKDDFLGEFNEAWEVVEEIIDELDKNEDADEDLMCYGLKIRFNFLPPQFKNVKSSVFLFFAWLKLVKLNEIAKKEKFINFLDGICLSGYCIFSAICLLLSGLCLCLDKFFAFFNLILTIILILELIASYTAKLVFQIW